MHADLERLAFLGVDPATLDPAPPTRCGPTGWPASTPTRRAGAAAAPAGRSRSPRASSSFRAWGGAGMTSAGTA